MGTEDLEKLVLRSYEHWCLAYDEAQTADNICARKHALHAMSEYIWKMPLLPRRPPKTRSQDSRT